jgi:hypothetical protein
MRSTTLRGTHLGVNFNIRLPLWCALCFSGLESMGSIREALRVQANDDVYERILQKQRDAILQSEKKT